MRRRFALVSFLLCAAAFATCAAAPEVAPPFAPPPRSSTIPAPSARSPSPNVALGAPTDADPSDETIVDRRAFVASWDDRKHTPNWVSWRLSRDDLGEVQRPRGGFHADDDLAQAEFKVEPSDYGHSGYDRGHLCPSADRTRDEESNHTTFLMTNMVPQKHALNAGPWEELEKRERQLALGGHVLYIVAGALFDRDPPRIGRGVAVPRATYKVIVDLARGDGPAAVAPTTPVIAAIMPNDDAVAGHHYEEYLATVEGIERASGYAFFGALDPGVRSALEREASSR